VFVTSILVIYYKHFSRQLFADLQGFYKLRDELHVEWTQLLLEQGAWASDSRVEKIAREKLNMHLPSPDKVVVIKE
jgi:cell division protein FtsL